MSAVTVPIRRGGGCARDRRRRSRPPGLAPSPRPPASAGSPTGPTSGSRSPASRARRCCGRWSTRRRHGGHHGQPGVPGQRRHAAVRGRARRDGRIGADTGIEVSLFVGPREEWDIGSARPSPPTGRAAPGCIRGARQLSYAIDDVLRGVDHGIRGFLVADTGLLELLAEMQSGGEIPASVVWKVSAMLAPANPLTVSQLERLGASTINVPVRRHARPAGRDAVGDLAADRPVRGGAQRHGRRGPRPGSGRPGRGGRAHVPEVRAAQLAAALPQRPAPGGRGGRDRPGEGAPRPRGPGVDGAQRPGPGPVAARGGRASASRSYSHDPAQ